MSPGGQEKGPEGRLAAWKKEGRRAQRPSRPCLGAAAPRSPRFFSYFVIYFPTVINCFSPIESSVKVKQRVNILFSR